jgi:GAF domain-containing protein
MGREVHLVNVLQVIMQKTTELLEAERSSLFLYDPVKDELWSMVAQGLEIAEIRFASGAGIAGDVAATLRTANVPDAWEDRRFNPEFDKKTGFRTRSVLCMPLINAEGRLTGVIQALNKKDGGVFDDDDERLMEALGAQSVIAVERALMVESYVENQRMQEVLTLARDVETSMMPGGFDELAEKFGIDLTDGVDEAYDADGGLFTIERLEAVLKTCAGSSSGRIIDRFREAISDFSRGAAQSDDITMLVLKYAPTAQHDNNALHKNNALHENIASHENNGGIPAHGNR